MYYLIYGLLYLISLLPAFVLYGLSNVAAFALHKIFKYRKAAIEESLKYALPEKSEIERQEIKRQFYRNFTGSFVETIKLLSMSKASFLKRNIINIKPIQDSINNNRRLVILASHLFGWEYGNIIVSYKVPVKVASVYMTVQNAAFEKLMLKIRMKFGATLVSAYNFPKLVHAFDEEKAAYGLMADQRPPTVAAAYWLNFFDRPAPFTAAPEKIAQRIDADVFFIKPLRIKRGYYEYECIKVCEQSASLPNGEMTRRYRNILEEVIREQPSNYLWSHKRWKRNFEKQFVRKWIDDVAAPKID